MLIKNIVMAVATLRARRGRSLLTMLGVILAVASVTTVVSLGRGIEAAVTEQTNRYSRNVITVRPSQLGENSGLTNLGSSTARAALTNTDVLDISDVATVSAAVPLTVIGSTAQGDRRFEGVIFAVGSNLPEVLNQELSYGAFFTSREQSNYVAVLGADTADKMFDQKAPLGRSFTIRGQQYIVSGVLDRFATTPFAGGTNFNNAIFVSTAALGDKATSGAPVFEVLAKVDASKNVSQADAAISGVLAANHGSRDDFQVLSPSELAGQTTATFDLLTDFIVIAAAIMLFVSGIGIMNVMLVSVAERIHEIGIRKAVGATNRQILGQFMAEASALSITGSLLGALLSLITVYGLRIFSNLAPIYDWRTAGIACVVAASFGILFGSVPALRAARKDPIDALRSE